MRNQDKRKKYTFSKSSKPEAKPEIGPRQVVLLLGGTGDKVGREILADEELMANDHLRVGFVDSDLNAIGDLDRARAYSIAGVPAQELVDELLESPSSMPGAELLGDPVKLWENLGPSDDINSGSPYGERKWGLVALWYHVLRYSLSLMTFLMGLIRDLNKYEDQINEELAGNGRKEVTA